MQDRFVGDIGDFGKYGLLRARAGVWPRAEPLLPLGVAWYIPDPDTIESTPSGHGQKVEYLFNPKLRDHCRNCDKQLFGRLKQVVCCERDIKAVEDSDLLGDSASGEVVFRSKPIPMPSVTQRQMQGPVVQRRPPKDRACPHPVPRPRHRARGSPEGLSDAPQKDRAPKQLSCGSKNTSKYAFRCELESFMDLDGQSCGTRVSAGVVTMRVKPGNGADDLAKHPHSMVVNCTSRSTSREPSPFCPARKTRRPSWRGSRRWGKRLARGTPTFASFAKAHHESSQVWLISPPRAPSLQGGYPLWTAPNGTDARSAPLDCRQSPPRD